MKNIILLLIFVITGFNDVLTAQSPNWLWAKGANGKGESSSVSVDANGNVFMTGFYNSDSITFGAITLYKTSLGQNLFIVKYDASGNALWAKSAISSYDAGNSVSTDAIGDVYLTGKSCSTTITFGSITLTNPGGCIIFIVKYDATGNVLWARNAGSNNGDVAYGVSTDSNGSVFITGGFVSSNIAFGTSYLNNTGGSDVFIVKYDGSGNVLWTKSAVGSGDDAGTSISTDANGNVVITGVFSSPFITFGTTTLTNVGGRDIFIVKYDGSGNVLWAKSAGGTSHENSNCVSTDVNGNIIVTGSFLSNNLTFGVTTLTNLGSPEEDGFIVKYDGNGNVLWAKSAGGYYFDECRGVSTDSNGNVFITGTSGSPSITFGTTTLINNAWDLFIVKYDASGNVLWAKNAGGTGSDYGISVSIDGYGNAFLTGLYNSPSLLFGTTNLSYVGGWNIYLSKLSATVVGTIELSDNSDFSIAPNPFTTESIITFQEEQNNTQVKIFDVLGNKIKLINFSGKKYIIEKGEMKAGIYFVQLVVENKNVVNKKIIVQ